MKLLPIELDSSLNKKFESIPDCLPVLEVYKEYYQKIGFSLPWIGYFVSADEGAIVGIGAFKGGPVNGKVEIAYSTFSAYEGKGIGTEICKRLVALALRTDDRIRVTARTLKEGHASISILKKNGFQCNGTVVDEDDGEVLEWEYKSGS